MKYVALLVLGLFIGALGAVAGLSALRQGTPYDDAVMTVMSQQMGALRGMREKNQCDVAEISRRFGLLSAIAGETEHAFLPIGDDAKFTELAGNLRDAVMSARSRQPENCDELGQAMAGIAGACKACHDVFR
ncbi:cytochrome c [Xanthomonadaceae bacterium JHOS43]|nr:cytochrome c [Xanthomonadaceae bacterium JHOS43]MCX7564153.1 cytochrome c [Xanthomonadaceae bacterium XH05]